MRITKTKIASVVAATAVVALGGTAAMAYWTETGSGSGSAATGTTHAIDVFQTSTVSGLFPAGTAQALSGDFINTNPSAVHLTTVTGNVTDVTEAAGVTGTCNPADFVITGTGTVTGSSVPHSATSTTHVGSWSGLNVAMTDTGANQDVCKNATLVISYSAS
jgi:hypothetical protein